MSKMRFSPELCARLIENGIDKYVMNAGRDTIALNAAIDSSCSGWARIPGPGACDFCVTLGSREDLYHSRFTAGGDERHGGDEDRFHPFCRCGVVPVFEKGGKAIAVDPDTGKRVSWNREELLDRYAEISASDKVPHHGSGKGGKLSWERAAEYVERIKATGTMDELKAICSDIDAAIPASLKKSSQYRCLQMHARGKKEALKNALAIDASQ